MGNFAGIVFIASLIACVCGCDKNSEPDDRLLAEMRKATGEPIRVSDEHTVEVHKIGSGLTADNEWVLAESTTFPFSVRLPATYTDMKQSVTTEKGNTLHVHNLGCKLVNGVAYAVVIMEGGDPRGSGEWAAALEERYRADLVSKKSVACQGIVGVELEVRNTSSRASVRAFEFVGFSALLVAEFPVDVKFQGADVAGFFDSFQIKEK